MCPETRLDRQAVHHDHGLSVVMSDISVRSAGESWYVQVNVDVPLTRTREITLP